MATRASIKISDSNGNFVANIYHHYDGYPEGLGAKLIEICDSGKIVNGLTLAPGKKFNGQISYLMGFMIWLVQLCLN